jgi:NADH-ubiquinone oxidoreductase chain 5
MLVFESGVKWIDGYYLIVEWTFVLDLVNCLLILLVTLVSFLVHIYSYSYMKEDISFNRFIAYLSLFTFFMLFLATSANFLQLFFGWEGVGLCSYLLINFWFTRVQANKSAIKAMLVNKIGDVSLLIAIGFIFWIFHSMDFSVVFAGVPTIAGKYLNFWFFEITVLNVIAFFLFLAAMGKSAQLGLHVWLPDAMEGPTPVSALIHAATMVTAGIFLIIRCNVIFNYAELVLDLMVLVGSLTVFFGASVALFQYDIKKVIAFSTCSQLGYMMVACGLTRYDVSLYHLVNHGFFKALLFLAAGVVIHSLGDEQDMRRMGGLVRFMPFTYTVFLIGSLSLAGFPFFSGFYSKDLILEACLIEGNLLYLFSYILCVLGVFFTAAYSFRLLFLTFLVKPNGFRVSYMTLHEADFLMIFVLTVLCLLSIFSGFFSKEYFIGVGNNLWGNSIGFVVAKELLVRVEFLDFYMKLVPTFFMLLGSFCSIFYHYKYNVKIYFYNIFFKSLRNFSFVYGFFNQKWFFDFLYNSFVVNFFLFFGYHVLYVKIDKGILEIVGPYGFYNFFLVLYDKLYGLQVNNIIMYLFYVFVIFSIFFVFFFSIFTITFDFVFVIGAFLLLYER